MKRPRPNSVTDDQGRQRFHGAFTGGFSAGYFNTVGSAEGFKPAEFISSRSNRADRRVQSVQDYMDEEDGLLSGSLQTKKDLDSFASRGADKSGSTEGDRAINLVMEHFIVEPLNTMGKKLLQQVGWKPGHAIGPRRRVKDYFKDAAVEQMVLQSYPRQSEKEIAFVPRIDPSQRSFVPQPAEGHHGLGYDPRSSDFIRSTDATTSSNRYRVNDLFRSQKRGAERSAGNRGGSSAVVQCRATVYDDDDDDIAFDHDTMDVSLSVQEMDRDEADHPEGVESSESAEVLSARLRRCPSDDKPPLPGFLVARHHASTFLFEHFPGPTPPSDFKSSFKHSFAVSRSELLEQINRLTLQPEAGKHIRLGVPVHQNIEKDSGAVMNTAQPAALSAQPAQSEQPIPPKLPSVFDLLRPADRDRLLSLARQANQAVHQVESTQSNQPPLLSEGGVGRGRAATLPAWAVAQQQQQQQSQSAAPSTSDAPPHPPSTVESRPLFVPRSLLDSGALASVSAQLQNRFTSASAASSTATALQAAPSIVDAPLSAPPSAPLSGMFTAEAWRETQQQQQQSITSTQPRPTKPTLALHKSRRTTIAWQPATLLCKRCKVPVPDISTVLPSSSITTNSTEVEIVDPISQIIAPQKGVKEADKDITADVNAALSEEQRAKFQSQDIYLAPASAKPPLSVFRSIFDSDNEEDDNDEGDDSSAGEVQDKPADRVETISCDKATRTPMPFPLPAANHPPIASPPPIAAQEDKEDLEEESAQTVTTARFIPRSQRNTLRPPRGGLVVGTKKVTHALPRFSAHEEEDNEEEEEPIREIKQAAPSKKRFRVSSVDDDEDRV